VTTPSSSSLPSPNMARIEHVPDDQSTNQAHESSPAHERFN
jgi:hypothetical protein